MWKTIDEFPSYSVSDAGQIRNEDTDRLLAITTNQHGVAQVGLMKNRTQYKRGIALLVASAFLPPPRNEAFNTPINLDGDRLNNHVDNLEWRPRWFAIKYHQQFHTGLRGLRSPIIDLKTKEWFPDSWTAAVKYGLLDREILLAILNRTYVWPTYQEFGKYEE